MRPTEVPRIPLFLGVDGGGTSTTAHLADAEGAVLGRGVAGPSNPKAIGFDAAFQGLDAAIDAAWADAGLAPDSVRVACLGLAGFAQAEDQARLSAWAESRQLAGRLIPVSDGDLVLAAGTPMGLGVAVIAGTGSIAVGRGTEGAMTRAGGWGYLFGDEGSAYVIALAALRRCARRADGREAGAGPTDPLINAFLRVLGVARPTDLVSAVYAKGMDRTRIAALASVVLDTTAEDPTIGTEILRPAGADLGAMVTAVAQNLNWIGPRLPVALAGGFLLRAPEVQAALLDRIRAAGFEPEPTPVPDPVAGALVLARRTFDAAVAP